MAIWIVMVMTTLLVLHMRGTRLQSFWQPQNVTLTGLTVQLRAAALEQSGTGQPLSPVNKVPAAQATAPMKHQSAFHVQQ
eukprot:8950737-Ditylum_brightwellii.AAC.1